MPTYRATDVLGTGGIKSLLQLRTPKLGVIKDWRLGALLITLSVLVCVYCGWDIVNNLAYLEYDTPEFSLGTLYGQPTTAKDAAVQSCARGNCDYCENSMYDWRDEFYNYKPGDSPCEYHTFDQSLVKGEEHFSVITAEQVFSYWEYDCNDPSTQPDACEEVVIQAPPAKCVCGRNTTHMIAAPEEMEIFLSHSYSLPDGLGPRKPDISYVRVANSNENLKVFDHSNDVSSGNIKLTLRDILTWTNSDLDTRWDPTDPSTPYYRLTGLKLSFHTRYFNYDLQPGAFPTLSSRTAPVVAIIEIDALEAQWSSLGPSLHYGSDSATVLIDSGTDDSTVDHVDVYRYGVIMVFSGGGKMGKESVSMLIQALTQAILLLGFINTLVAFFATHGQGYLQKLVSIFYWPASHWDWKDNAAMYKEFLEQSLYPSRRQAQFAVDALNAALTFAAMDKNANATISRDELKAILSEKLVDMGDGAKLSEVELSETLDLIITCAFTDPDNEEEAMLDIGQDGKVLNELTLPKWINLSTQDGFNVETLKRVLRKRYVKRNFTGEDAAVAMEQLEHRSRTASQSAGRGQQGVQMAAQPGIPQQGIPQQVQYVQGQQGHPVQPVVVQAQYQYQPQPM